jgi:hypothetical protein
MKFKKILTTGIDGFEHRLSEAEAWFAQQGNLRGYKANIYNI